MKRLLAVSAALLLAAGTAAQPKVIAHRGYWQHPGSAQNSLASLAKADSIGCYGSEFDVWMTADKRLVVNHDRTYRGTDIRMDEARASLVTAIVLPNGERIPTLDAY
ncbi:MAG: glycerophosphodiester phosphodiesterase, partial [Alistipes sp.]|nr:glycerophosphodiester phosphodiesterase [Alistipes sp.]